MIRLWLDKIMFQSILMQFLSQILYHINMHITALLLSWALLHKNYGNFTITGISAIYGNYHSNTAP